MIEPTQPEPRRNLTTGFMAIGAALLLTLACLVTAFAGGWWWVLFAPVAFLDVAAIYGIGESFQKAPRDADGNRLKVIS